MLLALAISLTVSLFGCGQRYEYQGDEQYVDDGFSFEYPDTWEVTREENNLGSGLIGIELTIKPKPFYTAKLQVEAMPKDFYARGYEGMKTVREDVSRSESLTWNIWYLEAHCKPFGYDVCDPNTANYLPNHENKRSIIATTEEENGYHTYHIEMSYYAKDAQEIEPMIEGFLTTFEMQPTQRFTSP